MKENFEAILQVNNSSVELNPFVEDFLARTVFGAISSLRGVETTQALNLYIQKGDVKIIVNGSELPLTPFPKEIIVNTLTGLVSSLKGVGKVETMNISVKVR